MEQFLCRSLQPRYSPEGAYPESGSSRSLVLLPKSALVRKSQAGF